MELYLEGKLIFNMLVLVSVVKMAGRVVREKVGLKKQSRFFRRSRI